MEPTVKQKFQKEVNKCDICFEGYDRLEKTPVIICPMHHTICKSCMKSIEKLGVCPFCREKIDFSKVVVNNYIFNLLPAVDKAAQQKYQQKLSQDKQVQRKDFSINQQPQQHIYPQDYYVPPIAEEDYPYQESDFLQGCCCCDMLTEKLHLSNQRKVLYLIMLVLQMPFVFIDLFFAIFMKKSGCMDTSHGMGYLVVRPWLMSMALIGGGLAAVLIFFGILTIGGCFTISKLKIVEIIVGVLFLIKIFIWCFVELELFSYSIGKFCSGPIFAYGIVLTILHSLFLVGICITSLCSQSRL